jgi:hypothetical protein
MPIIPIRKPGESEADAKRYSIGTALGALGQIPSIVSSDQHQQTQDLGRQLLGLPPAGSLEKVRSAKTEKDLSHAAMNYGPSIRDREGQRAIADSIRSNEKLKLALATALRMNPNDLMTKLEQGDVPGDALYNQLQTMATRTGWKATAASAAAAAPTSPAEIISERYRNPTEPSKKAVKDALPDVAKLQISSDTITNEVQNTIIKMEDTWKDITSASSPQEAQQKGNAQKTALENALKQAGHTPEDATKQAEDFVKKALAARTAAARRPATTPPLDTGVTADGNPIIPPMQLNPTQPRINIE